MAPTATQKGKQTDGLADDPQTALVAVHQKYLDLVEEVNTTSSDEMTASIVARILEGDSVDDILGMGDSAATGARQIVGRPFKMLEKPVWAKGVAQFADVAGVFVIVQCAMQDTGEVLPITTGGENVLAQLYAMQAKGLLPTDTVMTFREQETASGWKVLWLVKYDQSAR